MKQKLLYIIAWVTILSAMGLMLLTGYWLLYPYVPAHYNLNKGVQNVSPKTVYGGQYITVIVDFCKNTTIVPTVSRTFVDGIVYQIPPYTGVDTELGCHIRTAFVYVPKALPPGMYHITTHYRWQVNPLRTIEIINSTEKFKILGATNSAVLR